MSAPDQGHHKDIAVLPLGAVDRHQPIAPFMMLQLPQSSALLPIPPASGLHLTKPILHQRKPQRFDRQLWQR